jgi:hypothetical protein
MLAKLFRAEVYKIIGNRWTTGFLIWIFPVGALGFLIVFNLILLISSSLQDAIVDDGPQQWTSAMIGVWSFANNPLGRLFFLGFAAVLFGGEYQWNTWKNVVPRSWRVPLLFIKFAGVATFVVFAFALMSVVMGVNSGVTASISGSGFGPSLNGDTLGDFARDYGLAVFTTFIAVVIGSGYAAIAAMSTRSILGSVIGGFVIFAGEGASIAGFAFVAWVTGVDSVLGWYRMTPTYNLINVASWISDNEPFAYPLNSGQDVSLSLGTSLLVLAITVTLLFSLAAFLFQRQDITN